MAKRAFALIALLILLSAQARAETGFTFFTSSAVFTGDQLVVGGTPVSTTTALFVSTSVYNTAAPYYSSTQTTPDICIPASTLTWTANGTSTYKVGFSGVLEHTGTGTEVKISFRYDGGWYGFLTDTLTPASHEGNAGDQQTVHWYFPVVPTAGEHSVCFLLWAPSGTVTIPVDDVITFFVEEIK